MIVWAPDRFGVPTDSEIEYFESWLDRGAGRTLVFIGRDYDASIEYWQQVLPQSGGEQQISSAPAARPGAFGARGSAMG